MECIQETGSHQTEYVGGICTDDGVKCGDPDPRPRLLPGRLQRRHQGDRAERHPGRRTAAGQHPAAPRLRRDGRDRHGAAAARRSGSPSSGGNGATSRRRRGSCARSRSPARGRSSRSGAAGSSPRSAASRGSSRATCGPPKRSPRRTGSGSASASCCCSTRRSARSRSSSCAHVAALARRPSGADARGRRPPYVAAGGRPERGGGVSKADAAAAILWVGATFYALFGGADFGGGFWDLIAGDAEKGERPRALIQRSLTPVWEANHVWLIFILVVLWTAFPPAFSAVFDDPLRADRAGRAGDRPARRRLRLPQVDRGPRGAARGRRHLRPLLGPDPVLHGRRGRRDRLRQRPRRRQRRRLLQLAGAAAAADRGDVRRHRRLPRRRLPGRRRAPRRRSGPGALLRAPGAGRGRGRRRRRRRRPGRAARRSPLRLRPPRRPGPAAGDPLRRSAGSACSPSCCAAAGGRCARSPPAPWSP